jgi:hypothetical protein
MRIVFLGLVLLLAGAARLGAAAYFVDYAGGSDANAGTDKTGAWKHCPGDPAAGGVAARVALAPGDTIHFKGGVEYVLTGATGVSLQWDGASGATLTYDGNSSGAWGNGRAILTDRRGGGAISAFAATSGRQFLAFKSFDFFALGGAAVLPPDAGSPLPARSGRGIAFGGGAADVLVEDCVFSEIGYWQNQKPMVASSLGGIGISGAGSLRLTINRCTFSRIARGCDLSAANGYSQVKLTDCVFGEALVWPLDLPPEFGNAAILSLEVVATTFPAASEYYGTSWSGYGAGPLTEEIIVAHGEPVAFSASALASPAARFTWFKDGVEMAGVVGARMDLGMVDAADVGTYVAVASNASGSARSNSIILTVAGAPPPSNTGSSGAGTSGSSSSTVSSGSTSTSTGTTSDSTASSGSSSTSSSTVAPPPPPAEIYIAPLMTLQPIAQSVLEGSGVSFTVAASGTPAPSYQWEKNGVTLPGATGAVLTLSAVTTNDNASYRVVASNLAGSVTSQAATLTVTAPTPVYVAPAFTRQPANVTVDAGGIATFSAVAVGTPAPSFQWEKNGVIMPGATVAVLTLSAVTTNDNASYRVVASNLAGTVTSQAATLTVVSATASSGSQSQPPLLLVKLPVTFSDQMAVTSFNVPGDSPRRVLIRALGPTFAAIGGGNVLSDPKIYVYQSSSQAFSNDNWGGGAELARVSSQVGAIPFLSPDSRDAALIVTLQPGFAVIVVSGMDGTFGNVLVEAYLVP